MKKNKIFIAADHAGFEMKEAIKKSMSNIDLIDLGTDSTNSVDYPDFAYELGKEVTNNENSIGILICGTGIGMSIAANKIKNIRCANLTTTKFAKLAKEHNCANVISLSSRFVTLDENIKIINTFISSEFDERHLKRVEKLNNKIMS